MRALFIPSPWATRLPGLFQVDIAREFPERLICLPVLARLLVYPAALIRTFIWYSYNTLNTNAKIVSQIYFFNVRRAERRPGGVALRQRVVVPFYYNAIALFWALVHSSRSRCVSSDREQLISARPKVPINRIHEFLADEDLTYAT